MLGMDARLKKIFTQLAEFWKSLSKKKKLIIISGFVGIAAVITIVLLLANTVSYTLLYSGLDPSEAGQIADKLQEMNIPMKIQGSSNIYVDKNQADRVKMTLAEEGYPKTTLTYDTFMKSTSWAMTDSDKEKLALYQLQDRLQDTIKTISGVKSADVTIGQGNSSNYVLSTDKVPVTASVKLNLITGTSLTAKQVQGIALLVARSVPNLDTKNVTVIDSDGIALNSDDTGLSGTTSNLELQNKISDMVKQKVLAILEPIYGEGKVKVAAGVSLDFSSTVTNKTTYSANSNGKGIPSNEDITIEGSGTSSLASGTPGVNNGVPTYSTGSQASGSGVAKSQQQTNYLVDTVNQQIKDEGGKVSKLTVAVVLDSKSAAASNTSGIAQTVAYSVGIDPQYVSVQAAPFASAQNSNGNTQAPKISNTLLIAIASAVGLFLILLVILLFNVIGHKKQKNMVTAMDATGKPTIVTAGDQKIPENAAVASNVVKPAQKSIDEILQETQDTTKSQIEDFADQKPELVAQLLRNWLNE